MGEAPEPIAVSMNGATYMADIMGGQKTGLFYDQRPNHAFTQRLAKGKRVLDVFSHVGGFALASLSGWRDTGGGGRQFCLRTGLGRSRRRRNGAPLIA